MYSYNKAMKEIRAEAKKYGLVFKSSNTKINGITVYTLLDRKTGDIKMSNYRFDSAYNDACSGAFEQLSKL